MHTATIWRTAEAVTLAAQLNADKEDDWNYTVKEDPKGTGGSLIAIYEPHGAFVDYL